MIWAIVLAGGSGKRFGGNVPKQYTDLCGKPVLAWSLLAFQKSCADGIVLVCSEKDTDYCKKEIISKYGITKCCAIVAGGSNRYDSVYFGLKAAADLVKSKEYANAGSENYCLIHDGARCCIDAETINEAAEYVRTKGSCVVGVPVTDTIQMVNDEGDIVMTPERSHTWAAQTPQCFELQNAYKSYCKVIENKDESITDDASAVRKYGEGSVHMLAGKRDNIKITTADDMKLATEIIKGRYCAEY